MEFRELKVEERKEKGKGPSRRLRAQGKIPAVFYGEKVSPTPITIALKDFSALLQSEGTNVLIKLKGLEKNQSAMIKEIQKHPFKDTFLHVDFVKIALDEAIETTVPLEVVGESPGVKEGGVLQHILREIEVKALPKDIPEKIPLDISHLQIGDSVKVMDLEKPEGAEIISAPEDLLVAIVPPTELKVEEVAVEEEVAPEVVGEEVEEGAEEEERKKEAPEESAKGKEEE